MHRIRRIYVPRTLALVHSGCLTDTVVTQTECIAQSNLDVAVLNMCD